MMTTAPMEALEFSAVAAKFRQLDHVTAPAPWDPLSVYIVDINNSPEQYLKTVEQVVASRPPTGIVLLYNMEELVLAKLPDDQGQLCVVSASPLQDQG